jgi:hypothetical protein
MNYNERKLKNTETLLDFATQGFMSRVREIGEALTTCHNENVKVLAEQLFDAIEAMESAESDIKYYKNKCSEELV